MDASIGLCGGCLRTLDEITAWSAATEEQKKAIWTAIEERRIQHGRSQGS